LLTSSHFGDEQHVYLLPKVYGLFKQRLLLDLDVFDFTSVGVPLFLKGNHLTLHSGDFRALGKKDGAVEALDDADREELVHAESQRLWSRGRGRLDRLTLQTRPYD
jgi:hypothetical protein